MKCRDCRCGERSIRTCAYVPCGQEFRSRHANAEYCSRTCSNRANAPTVAEKLRRGDPLPRMRAKTTRRRAALAAVRVGPEPKVAVVGERDGWMCYLCMLPVDPALSGRVRWGPTIDHVIPIAAGGEHSYENVRLAHRYCNLRKGKRVLGLTVTDAGPARFAESSGWRIEDGAIVVGG